MTCTNIVACDPHQHCFVREYKEGREYKIPQVYKWKLKKLPHYELTPFRVAWYSPQTTAKLYWYGRAKGRAKGRDGGDR